MTTREHDKGAERVIQWDCGGMEPAKETTVVSWGVGEDSGILHACCGSVKAEEAVLEPFSCHVIDFPNESCSVFLSSRCDVRTLLGDILIDSEKL